MALQDYYIGLMSGTSLDGIDAVIVDLAGQPRLLASSMTPYPQDIRLQLGRLCHGETDELAQLAALDVRLGQLFASVVLQLLKQTGLQAGQIKAIGSHGQTVRHLPHLNACLQIADPNIIAERTEITTVADFRRRDLAAGGQGAPLVPAFHNAVFRHTEYNRVIVNIGGIANITLLPADPTMPVVGFDSGPGNTLLDHWIHRQQQQPYDADGRWAAQGQVNDALLAASLADDYFQQRAPKSTGPEYFNLDWLANKMRMAKIPATIAAVDVQATLCALTVDSIADAIATVQTQYPSIIIGEVYVCGGGAHNSHLMQVLQQRLSSIPVQTTAALAVAPDWVEAMAFAWLAKQTLAGQPGNLPAVTGASHRVVLGGVYRAR